VEGKGAVLFGGVSMWIVEYPIVTNEDFVA